MNEKFSNDVDGRKYFFIEYKDKSIYSDKEV